MAKQGKRYAAAAEKIESDKLYAPDEALALIKDISTAKFDETVELHVQSGLDPRHAEQQIRGSTVLPHGLGKEMVVLVFTEGDAAREASEAGAEHVGGDDLIKQVSEGFTDFDVAIATREMMGKVGRLGRVLGPRGLMPNPRSGTVVPPEDITRSVTEAKKGRVEFRMDRLANIHCQVGKASFDTDKLNENMTALIEAINAARPQDVKAVFVKSVSLTTTMGPAIPLDVNQTLAMKSS